MATAKQQFIRFLKDNNVYGNYMCAFENRELYKKRRSSLKTFFPTYKPEQYLLCAFDWDYTNEGMRYWYNLHKKWMHYLDNIKNNQEIIHYDFNKKIIYQIP